MVACVNQVKNTRTMITLTVYKCIRKLSHFYFRMYTKQLLRFHTTSRISVSVQPHYPGRGLARGQDLDLDWCLNVQASSGAILSLTEQCRGLKRLYLYLTAYRKTGDRELAALTNLTSLEQLDILGAVSDLLARLTSPRGQHQVELERHISNVEQSAIFDTTNILPFHDYEFM